MFGLKRPTCHWLYAASRPPHRPSGPSAPSPPRSYQRTAAASRLQRLRSTVRLRSRRALRSPGRPRPRPGVLDAGNDELESLCDYEATSMGELHPVGYEFGGAGDRREHLSTGPVVVYTHGDPPTSGPHRTTIDRHRPSLLFVSMPSDKTVLSRLRRGGDSATAPISDRPLSSL